MIFRSKNIDGKLGLESVCVALCLITLQKVPLPKPYLVNIYPSPILLNAFLI